MDFDQIAEEQGWTTETMLEICRDYITMSDGSSDLLGEFAANIANLDTHGLR